MIHQKSIWPGGRTDLLKQGRDVFQRCFRRIQLVLTGGQMIIEPRQYLTLLGHLVVYPAYAVDNASIAAGEDQVRIAAHDLQNHVFGDGVAKFVCTGQRKVQHTFHGGLRDGFKATACQMLPKQHAEHGGRCGILYSLAGKMGPW